LNDEVPKHTSPTKKKKKDEVPKHTSPTSKKKKKKKNELNSNIQTNIMWTYPQINPYFSSCSIWQWDYFPVWG
jgi:hypothetical protein